MLFPKPIALSFFDKLRFQFHGTNAINLTVNIMTITRISNQTDGLYFRTNLHY